MQRIKYLAALFLTIFFIYSLAQNFFEYRRNLGFYRDTKNTYEKELEKNKKLKTGLAVAADSFQFETQVRNKLNMHKSDEIVVMLQDPTATPTPPPTVHIPTYRQWVNLFIPH